MDDTSSQAVAFLTDNLARNRGHAKMKSFVNRLADENAQVSLSVVTDELRDFYCEERRAAPKWEQDLAPDPELVNWSTVAKEITEIWATANHRPTTIPRVSKD